MKLSAICLLMLSLTLMGCSLISETKAVVTFQGDEGFEDRLADLTEQLTKAEQFSYQEKPVAFTTLVWMDTLTFKNGQRATAMLGHQISSTLKTELIQRGGQVVEHKSGKAISMSKNASYYLTRNLNDLSENIEVSYVLAGTMLEIKDGVEVNVEVIDTDSHLVVSSARTFIPYEYLPELSHVFTRDGKIYRGQL